VIWTWLVKVVEGVFGEAVYRLADDDQI